MIPRDSRKEPRRPGEGTPTVLPIYLAAEETFHEAIRLGQQGEHDQAKAQLKRVLDMVPNHVPSYDNLASIHYLQGDVRKAIAISERVDRKIAPNNVFTLGSLVHYYLLLGRIETAKKVLMRLRLLPPPDEDALCKKCETLARFRDHPAILEEAEKGLRDFGEVPGVRFFAGTAAANIGKMDLAQRHLRRARRQVPYQRRARRYLKHLKKGRAPQTIDGEWQYLEFFDWVPLGLMEKLQTENLLKSHSGSIECLVAMLNDHPEDGVIMIRVIRHFETDRARDVLRKIAFGTFGDDEMRMHAAVALMELGEIAEGEPIQVLHEGKRQEMRVGMLRFPGAARPRPRPPAA